MSCDSKSLKNSKYFKYYIVNRKCQCKHSVKKIILIIPHKFKQKTLFMVKLIPILHSLARSESKN